MKDGKINTSRFTPILFLTFLSLLMLNFSHAQKIETLAIEKSFAWIGTEEVAQKPEDANYFNNSSSDGENNKYFKKAIAYYDNTVLVSGNVVKKPSDKNRKYLANLISRQINLPRFYWESLPEQTVSKFDEVSSKIYNSLEEINYDVENYLAPELIKILDISKEMRALSLLTEAERNSFIATKAKSLGVSADKVEKIMNSGYVVVPFIEKYIALKDTLIKKFKTKDGERQVKIPVIKVQMQGGMTFFKVNFKNNVYSVKPAYAVVQKEDISSFVEIKDNDVTAAEDSAFKVCSLGLVNNFGLTVRNLFKLSAPVAEAGFNSISFPLGKGEGVRIDEGFDVFELVEDVSGEVKPRRVGFVRINKVGDNRNKNELSRAQIIIGGIFSNRIERGMFVEERPRLPGDIFLGAMLTSVKIQSGVFKLNEPRVSNDTLYIKSSGKFAITGRFNINVNLSTTLDLTIPQFWMTLGGGIGAIPLNAKFFGEDVKIATFASFNLGLMRKFYFRRFAVNFETGVSLSNFEFSIEKKNNQDTVKYALSPRNWFWGGFAGAGFEFVINPDINIGARVFYQFSQRTDEWSYLRKVGDKEERKKIKFGDVNLTGLMYQVYLNLSIKNFAKVRKFEE
jgi:hypothetical protein